MLHTLTTYHHNYIQQHYLSMSDKEMAAVLHVSFKTIASFRKREKLTIPIEIAKAHRAKAMTGRTTSTPQMDAIIKAEYLNLPSKSLAALLGKSDCFLRKRMQQLQLVVPPELIKERIKEHRFQPGQVPPNKGRKQVEYMTAEAIERTKVSRFKKGGPSINELHDGAITCRFDKSGREYLHIRVAKGKWKMLHVHVWEQAHGPVPTGHIIIFRSNDTRDCSLDNLEMITRAEHAVRNAHHDMPTDRRVAFYMATKSRKVDYELRDALLQRPDLLELKRSQLLLQKSIKNERENQCKSHQPHR